MEITDDNLKKEVFESEIPVLVDIYSDSCAPCKMLSKILAELSSEYKDSVKICWANMMENSTLISKFSVSSVPTILFFKDGKMVDKKVGLRTKELIIDDIKSVCHGS